MSTRRWKSAGSARAILGLLAVTVIFTFLAATAFGQAATSTNYDAYHLGYYGNANMGFPNAEVNIVNPGSTGGYSEFDFHGPPYGDLCANIYVFTSDQEMVECCSCFLSPNALRTLSLDTDLTSNPLANTGVVAPPHAGLIKIVSSRVEGDSVGVSVNRTTGACNATLQTPAGTKTLDVAAFPYTPYGSLRAWGTHVRETTSSPLFTVTETSFRSAPLSPDSTELLKLQEQCNFRQTNGSGHGRCTCGVGD